MKSALLICMLLAGIFDLSAQDYRIHFFQDGNEITILNEKVQLSKKPFQIQVELLKVDGVYGSCSLSDSLFQIPVNQSLPESDLIQWKIAVEPENNLDKDIIVSKESYFYWFYNPKVDTWHRFDPIQLWKRDVSLERKPLIICSYPNSTTRRHKTWS